MNDLIESIQAVIERTPPQLASDILEGGVTLTGGAAALYGLSEAISGVIRVPCRVAEDARDCVVLGCAKVLMDPIGMKHLIAK